jgi:hypothetical protein
MLGEIFTGKLGIDLMTFIGRNVVKTLEFYVLLINFNANYVLNRILQSSTF